MTVFEDIQADLTGFPDEVIRVWLEPVVSASGGWKPRPFSRFNKNILLGRNKRTWNNVIWYKTRLKFDLDLFDVSNQQLVRGIRDTHLHATPYPLVSGINDSKQRFDRAREYITEHGIFPAPIVILMLPVSDVEFFICDGYHRCAALISVYKQNKIDVLQPTWVGISPT